MISFACKTVDLKDIITCSFDLNKTEYELLMFLVKQEEPLTISDIAGKTGFERSTVQKAISKLLTKEVVERRQLNLKGGGYRFIYQVEDKEALKERMRSIVDGWHRNVLEAVKKW